MEGISGHADKNGLLNWLSAFETPIRHVFVVHGEDQVIDEFAASIKETLGYEAFAPYSGGAVDLLTDEILSEGLRIPKKSAEKPARIRANQIFGRAVSAAKRLLDVVMKNEGLSNKDLAKLESQILNLAYKWDWND